MLRSLLKLEGARLSASDGDIGVCRDFLFDDAHWVMRYMVGDTGDWLHRHEVLVSPISLGRPDWENAHVPVLLTREQIEHAPALDEDAPVSRQFERHWFDYFGYAYYWTGGDLWGAYAHPQVPVPPPPPVDTMPAAAHPEDPHLHSVNEVKGYHLHAHDGPGGHVVDFVVDDVDWSIRYLAVETRHGLSRRKVLLSSQWLEGVDWAERELRVDLDIAQIESSPEYETALATQREYEDWTFRSTDRRQP